MSISVSQEQNKLSKEDDNRKAISKQIETQEMLPLQSVNIESHGHQFKKSYK